MIRLIIFNILLDLHLLLHWQQHCLDATAEDAIITQLYYFIYRLLKNTETLESSPLVTSLKMYVNFKCLMGRNSDLVGGDLENSGGAT